MCSHLDIFQPNSVTNRRYKTYNVKFNFKLDDKILAAKLVDEIDTKKKQNNFRVIRIDKIVYAVFSSGHVNVTGVQDFDRVCDAIHNFNVKYKIHADKCSTAYSVDNSTSTAYYFEEGSNKRINISTFKKTYTINREKVTISHRPHYFPGVILRRAGKCTAILFSSGRFIIIGAKSIEEINEAYDLVCAIIKQQ